MHRAQGMATPRPYPRLLASRPVPTAVGFGLVLATVLGVTVSSGEFRHGTATSTYLATANRRRVMIAKLAFGWLAAVGVALGTLVRSQIAAVACVFIWSIFAGTIVGGVFNGIGPFLPFTAADTMAGARLGSGGFGFS